MSDLLQSQILESCRLALPEGLKELMSDISREVLRSQPENLYQFITDYLAALLDAREALSIACHVCGEVCDCACEPDLDNELRNIGLSNEDVLKAKNIIQEYFDKSQVKESTLLMKLAKKTSVTETQLVELQKIVQRAFQRHIVEHKDHQVSFANVDESGDTETHETSVSTPSAVSDFYKPTLFTRSNSTLDAQMKEPILIYHYQPCKLTESATTLAGSYIHLPDRVPYSVHDTPVTYEQPIYTQNSSVLNVLQSLLYNQTKNENKTAENKANIQALASQELISQISHSEEIDDTIKRVIRDDVSVLSKMSIETPEDVVSFKMERETSDEISSESDAIS